MGQFECKLQVSSFTTLFSFTVYTLLALLTLLASWPEGFIPFYTDHLIFLPFECILSQKKILSYKGRIIFRADNRLYWRRQDWIIIKKPWAFSRYGLLLILEHEYINIRKHLWLAYDNMTEPEWRQLRQFIFLFDARSSCLSI